VEFCLTYAGPLRADNGGARGIATHKQAIRRRFHLQLAQLWAQRPFLRVARFPPEDDDAGIQMGWGSVRHPDRISALTEQFEHDGFQFVPVVTSALKVSCALNILYLRSGPAGRIIPRECLFPS
jgi:hypothetical protein